MSTTQLNLILICAIAACGGDDGGDEPVEIADTPLAGLVGGESWTYVAGHTDASLSEGENDFFAILYPTAFTACSTEPDGPHLILSIPKTPGAYRLGLSLNMTFVLDNEENDNLVGISGRMVVDEVTATTVRGGIRASFDADNTVEGQFEVALCAD